MSKDRLQRAVYRFLEDLPLSWRDALSVRLFHRRWDSERRYFKPLELKKKEAEADRQMEYDLDDVDEDPVIYNPKPKSGVQCAICGSPAWAYEVELKRRKISRHPLCKPCHDRRLWHALFKAMADEEVGKNLFVE